MLCMAITPQKNRKEKKVTPFAMLKEQKQELFTTCTKLFKASQTIPNTNNQKTEDITKYHKPRKRLTVSTLSAIKGVQH